jgi:hypothetical protein
MDGGWVLPSRQAFAKFADEVVRQSTNSGVSHVSLFEHQKAVRSFLRYESPYRGCLLYHGVGVGKTCSSIAVFEALLARSMPVVVMTPASLQGNYIQEIRRCGDRLYSRAQRWSFLDAADPAFAAKCTELGLRPKLQKMRHSGVYVPSQDGGVALDAMPVAAQQAVSAQINDMIQARYEFIHYNGISVAKLDEMLASKQNPFSDKAIVIDEVHNVVSMAIGNGQRGKKLYQLLVEAEGAKIIALSATPIINMPHELSYLIGLVKGYDRLHRLTCADVPPAMDVVDAVLRADPQVDRFEVEGKTIRFTTLPKGFRWAGGGRVKRVPPGEGGVDAVLSRVQSALKLKGVVAENKERRREYVMPLPLDEEHFNKLFIDADQRALLHGETLTQRLLGCVSYFNAYDPRVYPKRNPTRVVTLPMSTEQWEVYDGVRHKERQLEQRAKNMAALRKGASSSIFRDATNVYRAFSRAVCNFAFPKGTERPWPSGVRAMLKEDGADEDPDAAYDRAIDEALRKLPADALRGEGLRAQSPKFAAVVEALRTCPGPALVYSQFRRVEGIGVLGLALKANGWAELQIARHAASGEWDFAVESDAAWARPKFIQLTSDKDRNALLLSVFNSDAQSLPSRMQATLKRLDTSGKDEGNLHGSYVKCIMITAAGAEGLSLQAVRQVHILEPYWNAVRVEQVIGRAVRANSHAKLPPAERVVDVFLYVMTFLESQKSFTIKKQDDGNTTDEAIYKIATRKAAIIQQVLTAMQRAAFDCELHVEEHRKDMPGASCYQAPSGAASEILASLDIDRDAAEEDERKPSGAQVIQYRDVKYVYDASTGTIYDLKSYERGVKVRVGIVKNGKVDMIAHQE